MARQCNNNKKFIFILVLYKKLMILYFSKLYSISIFKKREQSIKFSRISASYMTLYRNLGPITFQCQTQSFEIFSSQNSNLILQFKNYEQINLDQINQILSVYQLILKQCSLLEIYSEKNKPSSVLLHKGIRVGFEKINIQLLCRIIKQMITSIIHTQKITQGKIGEINKQMFFQIDGQLRYLYFPIQKNYHKSQILIPQIVEFFNQLKDDKEVSHRILLKKIAKCTTLDEILDETEYFLSIYHAKQVNSSISNFSTVPNQTFFNKNLNRTKPFCKTINENSQGELRNSIPFGFNAENTVTNGRNLSRRKYNLFKNAQINNYRNTVIPQASFNASTWRKPQKQNIYQNATFRVNSRAVHVDNTSQRGYKNTSNSLFNRASSVTQSPKKASQSKKKGGIFSLHKNNQSGNQYRTQESYRNTNFHKNSRIKASSRINQGNEIQNLNESTMSRKLQQGQFNATNLNDSQYIKNSSSSQWMKQMVQNSLQKWKNKQNQKNIITNKLKQKDKQGSTQVDSRSKFLEKYERPSYDILKQSNISAISQIKNNNFNEEYVKNGNTQVINYQSVASQKKLKKHVPVNRSVIVDAQKKQYAIQGQYNYLQASNDQNLPNQTIQITKGSQYKKHQNQPQRQQFQQSLQQINLCKSSIQNLALKNRQQQIRLKNLQRKKTSIKQICFQNTTQQRHFSDQSQTQRIQYSGNYFKNDLNKNKKEKQALQKERQKYQKQLNQLTKQLNQIFYEKQQIDYIGVAVVQTTDHLKNFQSICWQLPMFFLYKKFYQRRIKLISKTNQLLSKIILLAQKQKNKLFQDIKLITCKHLTQLESQNVNVEQSLKKLLKTTKKKVKKQYPIKQQFDYIEQFLHLDFTKPYDKALDQFVSMYLGSLLQAKPEFPQLVFHIVDIFEAILVHKGSKIDLQKKQQKQTNIQKVEKYFGQLIKKKEIKTIINYNSSAGETKKGGKK